MVILLGGYVLWNLSTGLKRGLLGVTAPYGSVAELFDHGLIIIRTGIRPTGGADAVETGDILLRITLDGNAFVTGTDTNGLNMALDGATTNLKQASGETWKGEGLDTGTAQWARWYANNADPTTGASTSDVRMDGTVSTSGADVNMANGTSIVAGIDSEVTDVTFTMSAG